MAITLTSGSGAANVAASKPSTPKNTQGSQGSQASSTQTTSTASDATQTNQENSNAKFADLLANLQFSANSDEDSLSGNSDLSQIFGRLSGDNAMKGWNKSDKKNEKDSDHTNTLVAANDNPLAFLMGIQSTQNLPQQQALKASDGGVMDLLKKGISREVLYGTETGKIELPPSSTSETSTSTTNLPNLFTNTLQQTQNPSGTPAPAANDARYDIQTPMHDQTAWSKQLGDRVVFMNQQGQQTAEIHLNPPNLGPLHVTLSFNSDSTTTASFVAQHSETRQAIQDALPQLREMFVQAGIALGDTNVSSQSQQQQQQQNQQETRGNLPHFSRDTAILPADSEQITVVRTAPLQRGNGLVDLFA